MHKLYAIDFATGTYLIDKPGTYLICEDIDWITHDPNSFAISILCDDVSIDLGGHTIKQIQPPSAIVNTDKSDYYQGEYTSGNIGIHSKNQSGITIKNGTILNVHGIGICLQCCEYITIENMTIRGCGQNGVIDTTFLYRNGGLFVMGDQAKDGSIKWSSHVRIINCHCSNNTSALDRVVTLGSLVQHTRNVEVRQSTFHKNANSSPLPSGVQFNVVGIDFVQCQNVIVEDCHANDNTSGGEPAGFFAWGENIRFVRCSASNNYTTTGNRACGFNISTTNNLEMIDCHANYNYNTNENASSDSVKDFSACGFRIGRAVDRGRISNCHAMGNYSHAKNAPTAGFSLNSTNNLLVENCSAIANRNTGTDSNGYVAGFLVTNPLDISSNNAYQGNFNHFVNCTAQANTVNRNPLFEQKPYPIVDSGLSICGNLQRGAGFILQNQSHSKIINSFISNNDGLGILLHQTKNILIENNHIVDNTYSSICHTDDVDTLLLGNNLKNSPHEVLELDTTL